MLDPDILKDLKLTDIPYGNLRQIAEEISIEVAAQIWYSFSGLTLYIPMGSMLDFFKRYIHENHTKYSPKELARRLGKSEQFVYEVLQNSGDNPNQISLFDEAQQKNKAG